MGVLDVLTKGRKSKRRDDDGAELADRPSKDPEGDRLLREYEEAAAEVETKRPQLDLAERTANGRLTEALARLEDGTTQADVEAARVALADVRQRRDVLIARKEHKAKAHRAHSEVFAEAAKQGLVEDRKAHDVTLTDWITRGDALARHGEAWASEAPKLYAERGRVYPEVPTVIGRNGSGPIMGTSRPGWDSRVAVLLGQGDPMNAVSWVVNIFKADPRAPHGGPLAHWRSLAEECGLLPMSEATKLRLAEERQRKADALVRNARAEERTRARLNTVWGDVARDVTGWK